MLAPYVLAVWRQSWPACGPSGKPAENSPTVVVLLIASAVPRLVRHGQVQRLALEGAHQAHDLPGLLFASRSAVHRQQARSSGWSVLTSPMSPTKTIVSKITGGPPRQP